MELSRKQDESNDIYRSIVFWSFICVALSSCQSPDWKRKADPAFDVESVVDQLPIDTEQKKEFEVHPVEEAASISKKKKEIKEVVLKKKNLAPKARKKSLLKSPEEPEKKSSAKKNVTRKDNRPTSWRLHTPSFETGEKIVIDLSYIGVPVGTGVIEARPEKTIKGKPVYHFHASVKSSDYYSFIYWVDDWVDTFVDKETFLPVKYLLRQHEKKQEVTDLQLFDHKKRISYHYYKRVKKERNKETKKNFKIPEFFQDSLSCLFFMRGLPFAVGKSFDFPVVTRGKTWNGIVKVLNKENISVDGKKMNAWKLELETKFSGVLKSKKKHNYLWVSADNKKIPLKFEAEVKIGSVSGELNLDESKF